MYTSMLDQLRTIGEALDKMDKNDDNVKKARFAVEDMAREISARLGLDGTSISVEDVHESYAIEAVTSYLDGAQRGDGFELLGETLGSGCIRNGEDFSWVVGTLAALARLAGDLAVIAAERGGEPGWEGAQKIIQKMAHTL
jgi:hypothetical protein